MKIHSSHLRIQILRLVLGFTAFLPYGWSVPVLPEMLIPQLNILVDQAMRLSPRMMMVNADLAAAQADMMVEKSARLPSVGGSASVLKSNEDRGDVFGKIPTDKIYYNFSINQTLFKWGEVSRNIENGKIRYAIDEGRTQQAYAILANDVRSAFLYLVRARRGLERVQFNLALSDDLLRETKAKRNQNLASDVEVFNAEVAQQQATYTSGISEDSFLVASATLARLTGTAALTFDEVPNEFPVPSISADAEEIVRDLAEFLSAAEPTNTDLKIALENLKIQQNNLKNTETSLRPKLNLTAGISLDDQTYSRNVADKYEVQSTYAGINLNWSIFDGFATKRRIRSSLARIRSAEIRYEESRRELIDNVQSHGRLLKTLALAVVIAERGLDSARLQLEAMKESETRGEASEAQINVLKLGYHDAMGAALYARHNYWNKLSSLLGLIDEDPVLDRIPNHVK